MGRTRLNPRAPGIRAQRPDFLTADLARWAGLIWTRVKARKATTCVYAREPIEPGDEVFKPVTNGRHRMLRVKASAWAAPTLDSESPVDSKARPAAERHANEP